VSGVNISIVQPTIVYLNAIRTGSSLINTPWWWHFTCQNTCLYIYIYIWLDSPIWAWASSFRRGFMITHLRHATVGKTPLDEGSARRRDLYLTTHNTHNRQTSMPPVGFESTILVSERPKTHALDRTATGIGCQNTCRACKYILCLLIILCICWFWLKLTARYIQHKINGALVFTALQMLICGKNAFSWPVQSMGARITNRKRCKMQKTP
jgi:hypothetical protein